MAMFFEAIIIKKKAAPQKIGAASEFLLY